MDQPRVQQFVDSMRRRQQEESDQVRPSSASVESTHTSAAPRPIFDPQLLSRLGRLELIARTVVDGFLSGKHRSTHKGGCTDFAEFRPYMLGDDIRQLDWRKYAKSDRYYVRRYDDETNLQALLIIDASGSMQFGMSTVSKWRYAQMTAACLGHLLLRQRDAVGLGVIGQQVLDYVRPLPRPAHLARILKILSVIQASGKSEIDKVLLELTGRLKRRGLVVLLSDCFGGVEKLKHALQQFRLRGHDVVVFQILAPEELTFPFRRESFFQDLEFQKRMQVNPGSVRKHYLKEFGQFMEHLQKVTSDLGVDLVTMSTDSDLGDTLAYYLRRRAAQNTATRTRARA